MFSKDKNSRSPKKTATRRAALPRYYRAEVPAADSQSPFTKKPPPRKTRKYLLGFLDVLIVLALIFSLGYSLIIRPQPKVIVGDYSFHSQSDYAAAVITQLGQIKNRNKITIDDQSISSSLQKQFPEIADVKIELPFFSEQPTIRIAVARPAFYLSNQDTKYVVSSNGIATANASSLPNINNTTTVIDQSGYSIKTGTKVLSSDSAVFISNLISQLNRAKIPIASLTLPTLPEELDLRTKDQSYFVKFYLGGDVLDQAGQFLAARKHFSQSNQNPSQYLDVRVSGKIFYK